MTAKMDIAIGDHVWWGDPAHPITGEVMTISRDGNTAFVKLDSGKKAEYTAIPEHVLRKSEDNNDQQT